MNQRLKQVLICSLRHQQQNHLWRSITCIFISMILGATQANCQFLQSDYLFTFYNSAHGLASSEIFDILKDERGFLWVGTASGVSRYDGFTFKNYRTSKEDALIGRVTALAKDENGRIWVGSGTGLYYMEKDEIIKVSQKSESPQVIHNISLYKNTMWLSTDYGPVKIENFSSLTNSRTYHNLQKNILVDWSNYWGSKDKGIHGVYVAKGGAVFVIKESLIYRIVGKDIIKVFENQQANDDITHIYPIDKNTIYFNCESTEMYVWENGREAARLPYNPNNIAASKGFWMNGTSGIYFIDTVLKVKSYFINSLNEGIILPTRAIQTGTVFWMGSGDGLVKIKPSFFKIHDLLDITPHEDFYSFITGKNGNLLIGNNRGIILEYDTTGFKIFMKNVFPKAEVKAMIYDQNGSLWVGSGYQGIAKIDGQKITNFDHIDGLGSKGYYSFLITNSGKLWAIGDNCITKIEPDKAAVKGYNFTNNIGNIQISARGKIFSAIETNKGRIYAASEEGLLEIKEGKLVAVLLDNKIITTNYIIKDANGIIWIATNGEGILKLKEQENGQLIILSKFQALQGMISENYISLLCDRSNNIWAGSSNGISVIGQSEHIYNKIMHFNERSGFLPPGYGQIKLFESEDGLIWTATTTGLASLKPEIVDLKYDIPKVHITNIVTKSQPYKRKIIPQYLPENTSFEFEFTGIDDLNQEDLMFSYKLEGFDTEWNTRPNTRSVRYDNLKWGHYKFKIKALNPIGVWSKETIYEFKILTPFWAKSWFIISCVLGGFLSLFTIILQREKNISNKASKKMELEKLNSENLLYQLEIEKVTNFFGLSIYQEENRESLLWNLSKELIAKLGFEDSMIYLWNEDKTILQQISGHGIKGDMQIEKNKEVYHVPKNKGIVGSAAELKIPVLVNDTSKDNRYFSADGKVSQSELAIPIIHNNEVMGVVNTEHSTRNFYTERHVKILSTIASMLGDKLDLIATQQKAKEKEIELIKLGADLAESQLTALRSQMNPHFIFNALNSIQYFIYTGEVDKANGYLSDFAHLMRLVLEQTKNRSVSLEEEIKLLNIYLKIESLRFDKDFKYEIIVADEISDHEQINIPGMIIQPLVENALKHGLPLKKGDKKIVISYAIVSDHLICSVSDNGIGIEVSRKLKDNQEIKFPHNSLSMSIINSRIQMLNRINNQITVLKVNQKPYPETGTTAIIKIPLQTNYF